MEVAIGANSYFKTGSLLTSDVRINEVGVVHLKRQGRCGKHKSENKRIETGMVRPCGEKDRRRCSNENMEVDGHRKIGRPKRRWSDAPTPNRENVEEKVSCTFVDPTWMCVFVIVVTCTFF